MIRLFLLLLFSLHAFRLAQQEMRKKYKLPYFWAGFVLVE